MLVKKKCKDKQLVIGRGFCSCKHQSYVYGKGAMDFITSTIIPNIGNIAKAGVETYKVARDIKDMIKSNAESNKDYKNIDDDVDLIKDVKAASTLSILKKLRELKNGRGFQII